MNTTDLQAQYNRILPYYNNIGIDYTAQVYYIGEPTDPTTQGELDVVLKNQTPDLSTVLTSVSDVTTYLTNNVSYSRQVFSDKPFAYYRLNQTGGTVATDATGTTSQNGTITATGVTLNQPSAVWNDTSKSMLFDGTNGLVTTPLNTGTATWNNFSLEFWFMVPTVSATSYRRLIANDYPQGGSNKGFDVVLSPTSDPRGLYFNWGAGTYFAGNSFGAPCAANQWYHVVITFATTAGIGFTAYINSVLAKVDTTANDPIVAGTQGIDFGGLVNTWHTNCYITEVAFYNYQLTQAQVTSHYILAAAP